VNARIFTQNKGKSKEKLSKKHSRRKILEYCGKIKGILWELREKPWVNQQEITTLHPQN
jgi:hypothetical protein